MKQRHEQSKTEFGGSLLIGKRKRRRPLNFKLPTHLVLKAINPFVLLKNKMAIEALIHSYSKKMNVRIYKLAIHADHIHLAGQFPDRATYLRWIRALTSLLVQKFSGLKWRLRPYTRISAWGKHFVWLKRYVRKNRWEGELILHAHKLVNEFREKLLAGFSLRI